MDVDPAIMTLSTQLADTAIRSSVTTISGRIGDAKRRKKDQETIAELEEIISELVSNRNELVRIAQGFEQELTGQRIAEADVEYITTNIIPMIQEIAGSNEAEDDSETQGMLNAVRLLLSVETVNILQLVGFNFRKAIGEPLTKLVAHFIASQAPQDAQQHSELVALQVNREIELYRLARDPEAYARLRELIAN